MVYNGIVEQGVIEERKSKSSSSEKRLTQHVLAVGLFVLAFVASRTSQVQEYRAIPIESPTPQSWPTPLTQAELQLHVTQEVTPVVRELSKRTYVVRPGDTLLGIARNHGTMLDRIVHDNKIIDPNKIFIGEELLIRFPSYLEPFLFGDKLSQQEREELKDAIAQRYNDLDAEDLYYFPGELDSAPRIQEGVAHIYGFDRQRESLLQIKSGGEPFNPNEPTCASWFYPLGAKLIVTYTGPPSEEWTPDRWKRVEVTVTDRGPNRLLLPEKNVIIDLTPAAARALEERAGTGLGKVSALNVIVQPTKLPSWWNEVFLPNERP